MRWKGREQSGNVEDRRGFSGGKMIAGGTLGTLAVLLIVWLMGGDPSQIINSLQPAGNESALVDSSVIQAEEELAEFAKVTLKDTEDIWNALFSQRGESYREPILVLYNRSVESACGYSSSATGPFYCPGDERVYIDLTFLDDLQQKLGATGDFAMAYIIAHEVGHHVQKQLGITDKVHNMRGRVSETEYNRNMVRLELQADFLAGVWAHYAEKTKDILEQGDLEEALHASAAVGDDRIQMQSQGYIVPDAFTHGTSEQRSYWFLQGYKTGDISQGDTFSQVE
jgi:predicted metalloprotease